MMKKFLLNITMNYKEFKERLAIIIFLKHCYDFIIWVKDKPGVKGIFYAFLWFGKRSYEFYQKLPKFH